MVTQSEQILEDGLIKTLMEMSYEYVSVKEESGLLENFKNGGVNGGVSHIQQNILDLIKIDQYISVTDIAQRIGKPKRTVENNMKQLKDKGIIERFGSDKTGGYRIKK
jgi:predicted HTH transcriptional regulator